MKGSTVRIVRSPRARKPSRHVSGIEALRQRIETLGDSREVIVRLDVQHIVLQPAAQRTDTPTGGDGRNVTRAHIGCRVGNDHVATLVNGGDCGGQAADSGAWTNQVYFCIPHLRQLPLDSWTEVSFGDAGRERVATYDPKIGSPRRLVHLGGHFAHSLPRW